RHSFARNCSDGGAHASDSLCDFAESVICACTHRLLAQHVRMVVNLAARRLRPGSDMPLRRTRSSWTKIAVSLTRRRARFFSAPEERINDNCLPVPDLGHN